MPLGRIDPGPPSLRDSASKSPSPCYCPFEVRKRREMLQVIFINSRKEKVPAAQLEEWTSLCQEPCYTEYPAKLLLLQNCCCCYKIVVVVTKLQYSKKLPVWFTGASLMSTPSSSSFYDNHHQTA